MLFLIEPFESEICTTSHDSINRIHDILFYSSCAYLDHVWKLVKTSKSTSISDMTISAILNVSYVNGQRI